MAGDNDKDKKGFSGLSDLASDVSEVSDAVWPEPASEAKQSPANQASRSTPNAPSHGGPQQKPTKSLPLLDRWMWPGFYFNKKWILGIIAISAVIWFASYEGQNSKETPHTSPPPTRNHNLPQNNPVPVTTPSKKRSSEEQYEKPPAGTNHVLSVSQMRWCFRESIRIETMRDFIDSKKSADEFNKIVADYNRRCGSYLYPRGSLDRARRAVEASRSQIVTEAIRDAVMLGQNYQPSFQPVSNKKSINNAHGRPSVQFTREAQKLLIELGYEPGPIDGRYGPQTAAAVKAFQRDTGLIQNGWIDEYLLSALRRHIKQQSRSISKEDDAKATD